MTTRRPCKLKFLVEIESITKIRISVTGCVVTQATKFVANIKSRIICKLHILQAKINEFLFSTRKLFVACMIIVTVNELAIPASIAIWINIIPASILGHSVRTILEKNKIDIPGYIMDILVLAVIQQILGLPLL